MKIFLIVNLILMAFFNPACGDENANLSPDGNNTNSNIPVSRDKTKLPKEMPAGVKISFGANYGMSPAYKKIAIDAGGVSVDAKDFVPEKKDFKITSQKRRISSEQLSALYSVFVENAFDTIENDKRKDTVYDAPSEGIFISLNDQEYFQKSYGDNQPMSGDNLKRYQTIRKAILDLAANKPGEKTGNLSSENQQVFDYSNGYFPFLVEDAKPATLNEDDFALLEKLLPKAVEDYNAGQKNSYRKTEDFPVYKRQIVPYLNSKGEKEIWINCVCNTEGQDWRKQIIMVKDGGNCYFNFKINLSTKKAFDFMMNGTA